MIKTRVIPVLLWDEHGAVKGQGFARDRRIGSMRDRIQLLEKRDVDELIILDVTATPNNRPPRFAEVAELTGNLFCPLTVGGGVRNLADIGRLLKSGADKVAIGTAALLRPEFITEASGKYGAQAVVIAIDVRGGIVRSYCGEENTGRKPDEWAAEAERRGAGEILLTDITRDGRQVGYNLDLIRSVANAVSIPVIAAGGCGSYEHMVEAMKAGAHAVASGAMFQFRETTPKDASRHLAEHGIATRV